MHYLTQHTHALTSGIYNSPTVWGVLAGDVHRYATYIVTSVSNNKHTLQLQLLTYCFTM